MTELVKDAFDQWREWKTKPADSPLTIPLHDAVMMLTPEERKNRAIVNETVRTQMSPRRPARSAIQDRPSGLFLLRITSGLLRPPN
jgi:hypothetical protein